MTDAGVVASITLNATGLADATLVLTYAIDGEYAGVWQTLCSGDWLGGQLQLIDHNDPLAGTFIAQPRFAYGLSTEKPANVRLRVRQNKTARYSADVTVR